MDDVTDFVPRTERYRAEILAHCYRMLGSAHDAEDLVQETYLRAWRSYDRFEERASVRSWLYRIATNLCLTALQHSRRRVLPSGLGAPSDEPEGVPAPPGAGISWLQPIPDALVTPPSDDPAAIAAARSGLRLALIASLQYLPPRQRAVLILRDVLAFPAAEVAEILDTSVAAVKSALQRARARLDAVAPVADDLREPTSAEARALLDSYMAAFEASDPEALKALLRKEFVLETPPSAAWFSGLDTCMRYFVARALGSAGDWRMVPLRANGQPGAAAYFRQADGSYRLYGIGVLDVTTAGISRTVFFGDTGFFDLFNLPPVIDPQG